MIRKDEVVLAYRLLLGRDPENDEVVTHYATEVKSLAALRELFINSPEFRVAYEKHLPPRPPRPSFSGPPMSVELAASPEKLDALFATISAQWHHLGATEPHWSVVTNDSYFQEQFHMNRAAFYASGQLEVVAFDATLKRAGVSMEGRSRCFELGCGVGRVTAPLARRFPQVHAVDISSTHLRVAQEHLATEGISNVTYQHLETIGDVARLAEYDVLYSRIVLQHNPPPVMRRMLTDLLQRLSSGGIAYFQIPTYKAGYHFSIDEYMKHENATQMEMHYFPQAALLDLLAEQRCRVLELREDDSIGVSMTAVSNTVLVQKA